MITSEIIQKLQASGIEQAVIDSLVEGERITAQIEKEKFETPEETIEIDKKIEKLLKEYSGSKLLKDGSIVLYADGIGIRHTRKDLLVSMLVRWKCISGIVTDTDSCLHNDVDYYKPIFENETSNKVVRMHPCRTKSQLEFGLERKEAVKFIKMLNKCNAGKKEFFLENY